MVVHPFVVYRPHEPLILKSHPHICVAFFTFNIPSILSTSSTLGILCMLCISRIAGGSSHLAHLTHPTNLTRFAHLTR